MHHGERRCNTTTHGKEFTIEVIKINRHPCKILFGLKKCIST